MPAIPHLPAAAPRLFVPGRGAELRGTPVHDTSLAVRRRTAPTPRPSTPRGGAAAPTSPPSLAGAERALARATVLPSLTPTAAPLRAMPDPHLIASTRRRHVRIELVLVVRRAERGSGPGSVALPGRRPTVSR